MGATLVGISGRDGMTVKWLFGKTGGESRPQDTSPLKQSRSSSSGL